MSKNVSFFGKFQVRFGRAEMSLLEMFQFEWLHLQCCQLRCNIHSLQLLPSIKSICTIARKLGSFQTKEIHNFKGDSICFTITIKDHK